MKRAHIFIEGKVQGVGFRHFTRVNAKRIGVVGWVKNLPDGRVEAVFEGEKSNVEQLVSLVRQGPPASHVTHVTEDWVTPANEFDDFRVRY